MAVEDLKTEDLEVYVVIGSIFEHICDNGGVSVNEVVAYFEDLSGEEGVNFVEIVERAVQCFSSEGLVRVDEDGIVRLTPFGEQKKEDIIRQFAEDMEALVDSGEQVEEGPTRKLHS